MEKLSKEESIEAIHSLECESITKETLLEMFMEELIELRRCMESPKELKIELTKRGHRLFTSLTQ